MTTTLLLNMATATASTRVNLDTRSGSVTTSSRHVTGMPLSVPRSQLYYWTKLWQDGVAVAHDALNRGDYVDFTSDDPNDVVRWLFEIEDDED